MLFVLQELEEQRQFLARGVIFQASQVRLNLRVARIVVKWLGNYRQAQGANIRNPNEPDARPLFDTAADQLQQSGRGGDLAARYGHARLIRTQLEVGTGDSGTGLLPADTRGNVTQKDLI